MFDSLRYYLNRLGRLPRLVAAGVCLTLAAAAALDARAAGSAVTLVVARHAMRAGQVVTQADLRLATWPRAAAPPGAARSIAGLVGRRAAAAIEIGEPISPARVVGTGLAAGLPRGTRAMSVPAADPRLADFVTVGDRVDLYTVAPDGSSAQDAGAATAGVDAPAARPVASSLAVLAVLPPETSNESSNTDAAGGSAEVVVAVDARNAPRIAVNSRQMFAVGVDPP